MKIQTSPAACMLLVICVANLGAQNGRGRGGGLIGGGVNVPPLGAQAGAGARATLEGPAMTATRPDRGLGNVSASQRLQENTHLSANLQRILPSGTTLSNAATGFQSEGEFVSALHVARNLNIPFADLKARMTGENARPLGEAIHELRPSRSRGEIRDDVRRAERQARADENAAHIMHRFDKNAALGARAQAALPPGTRLADAAVGFENEQQLLTAAHLSRQMNIPFDRLKAQATSEEHVSLERAVAAERPELSKSAVKAAVKSARVAADGDIHVSAK